METGGQNLQALNTLSMGLGGGAHGTLDASCTLALSSIPAISLRLQMPLPLSRHTAGHLQLLPKVVVLTIFSCSPLTLQPLLWLVFPFSRDPWMLGKEPHTRDCPRSLQQKPYKAAVPRISMLQHSH